MSLLFCTYLTLCVQLLKRSNENFNYFAPQITNNLKTPMNISAVRVEGTPHTRKSFLGFLIKPALEQSFEEESDLQAVLHATRRISHILHKSDIFRTVEAKVERARDVTAKEGDVDLVFKTKEKGRFYLNSSTELGNNEGSAVSYFYNPGP